jgi:Domain of unknown function (DUF4878)
MTFGTTQRWSALVLALLVTGAWRQAPPAQTATQFYKTYQAACAKATKVDDLLPFLAADQKKEIEATPADKRPQMFDMIKMMMSMHTDVTVVKEDHNADGTATLTLSGVDSDKKKASGKVNVVKEGGAWKVGKESWSS